MKSDLAVGSSLPAARSALSWSVGVMREGTSCSVGGRGTWGAEKTCFGKVDVQFAKVPVEAKLRSN